MFSIVTVTAATASTPQIHTTIGDSVEIDAKYKKASTNKITFNANGGKIGSKKTISTSIKKGAKINKLPATLRGLAIHSKDGFPRKVWEKISINTKPTKTTTCYAQYSKTTPNSKLVGNWKRISQAYGGYYPDTYSYNKLDHYYFYADGKFQHFTLLWTGIGKVEGKYSVSKGKVHLKEMKTFSIVNTMDELISISLQNDFRKLKYKPWTI